MIELKRLALLGIDAEIARLEACKRELLQETTAKPARVHWTQTPAGKKRLEEMREARDKKKAPATVKR